MPLKPVLAPRQAPAPLPRYMRPGGYDPGHTGDPHQGGGMLGNLMGWNGNPVYDALRSVTSRNSNALTAYGLSMLSGNTDGAASAFLQGMQADDADALRQQGMHDAIRQRDSYAKMLAQMGERYGDPMFQELADAVHAGGVEPAEAWRTSLSLVKETKAKQEELQRAKNNALFLTDPELKSMVETGALPFKEAYAIERGEVTEDMTEFQFAQENGYEGSFVDFLGQKGAGSGGGYGQTIYTGRDANGNVVPLRANPTGGLAQAQLPEGVTFDPGAMAGARAGATVDAKAAAEARKALPGAELGYEIASKAVEDVLADKIGQAENFGNFLGIPNQRTPTWPGTAKANFWSTINQLSGQAFLQIRQALKGAGQVTDYEGMKGEQALSRMRDAAENGDQKAFEQAVLDFKDAIDRGMDLLRAQAGGEYVEGGSAVSNGLPGGLGSEPTEPTAVNPQTGERLVYRGGQWVPAQ